MDSINSFIHLLDKIETQDRRLGMTIRNLRCLTGGKSMELAYAMALKLAEESEKLTLLTRALPAYTGNPRAGHPVPGAQELLSGQSAGSIPRKHHDIPPCI